MRALRRNVIRLSMLALALSGCSDDASGGSSTITLTAGPTPLAFAAAQVDDGPWEVITPSSDGKYTLGAAGQTYGIAAVCANDVYASVTVLQATAAETTTPSVDCYLFDGDPATLSGTITGVAGQNARLVIANRGIGMTTPDAWTYSTLAPAGTWDVFAERISTGPILNRIIRKKDVTLSANAPTVVDFDLASEGFAPEPHMVSFEGLQTGETTTVTSTMRSNAGGTSLDLSSSTAGTYLAFPAAELRADDVQIVMANAFRPGAFRHIRRTFVAAADFTATLPAMPEPTLIESETATPYLRMRATMPAELDADRVDLLYVQQASTPWTASLSRGYRERGNVTAYTLPDLSSLAGFDPSWGLVPGMQVDWQVVTWSSDADTGDLFETTATGERTDAMTTQNGQFP